MSITEKLMMIQSELKAPKGQFNSFGKYKYRSCEDIMEALKPVMAKHKTTLIITDEIVFIGDRYYIKAAARLLDIESSDFVESEAYAREEESKKGMDGSQVTGAASSYARKYALNGLFAIDDTKDADVTNTHGKGEETPQTIGQAKAEILSKLFTDLADKKIIKPTDRNATMQKLGVKQLADLTEEQYGTVLNWLKKHESNS